MTTLAILLVLLWQDAGANNELGFAVYRRLSTDAAYPTIPLNPVAYRAGNGTGYFNDLTTVKGMTYCYVVTAFSISGPSPRSNEVCATEGGVAVVVPSPAGAAQLAFGLPPTEVTIPTLAAAKLSASSVRLTWDQITDPQVGCLAHKQKIDSGSYVQITDCRSPTDTSYDKTGLTAGHTYTYKMDVYYGTGSSKKLVGTTNEATVVL